MSVTFVKNVGNFSSKTSGTTASITVPAAGCAAGNLLVIRIGANWSISTTPSDSKGNTYVRVGTEGICYSLLTTALVSGDTITIPATGTQPRIESVEEFNLGTNVTGVSVVNTSVYATSTSTTPTTAATVSYQSGDLLVGSMVVNGPSTDTYTEDATPSAFWNTLTRVGTTGGSTTSNWTGNAAYALPTSNGSESWSPTLGTSQQWFIDLHVFRPTIASSGGGTTRRVNVGGTATAVTGRKVNVGGVATTATRRTNVGGTAT